MYFDYLFKDLCVQHKSGCQVLGMDCIDVKIDVDLKDNRKSAVYLAINPNIDYNYFYVGSTNWFDENNATKSRPFRKDHQMFKYLDKNSTLYIIYGLSLEAARVLESYFIKYSNKSLSKKGGDLLNPGCLLNKRYEKRYEKLIEKYIIHNGDNPYSFAWRETYDN